MDYGPTLRGIFLSRPNRFVARVLADGKTILCHVKNTGRCGELLIPGAEVYLCPAAAPGRKTAFDLISVRKDGRLFNIDSSAPNKVFAEWVHSGGLGELCLLRPEVRYGDSRFDFYLETIAEQAFAEIKGVTLEEEGTAYFPDAPTERGVKHLRGLIRSRAEGYGAYAVFIVQTDGVCCVRPNERTHPAFGEALRAAQAAGVHLLGLSCQVTETSLSISGPVEVLP